MWFTGKPCPAIHSLTGRQGVTRLNDSRREHQELWIRSPTEVTRTLGAMLLILSQDELSISLGVLARIPKVELRYW